jgi:hypothetical protein
LARARYSQQVDTEDAALAEHAATAIVGNILDPLSRSARVRAGVRGAIFDAREAFGELPAAKRWNGRNQMKET